MSAASSSASSSTMSAACSGSSAARVSSACSSSGISTSAWPETSGGQRLDRGRGARPRRAPRARRRGRRARARGARRTNSSSWPVRGAARPGPLDVPSARGLMRAPSAEGTARRAPAGRAAARPGWRWPGRTSISRPPTTNRSPAPGMRPASSASRPPIVADGPAGSATPKRSSIASAVEVLPSVSTGRPPGAEGRRGAGSSLVEDLADQLLEQVLQRHDARACRRTRRAPPRGGAAPAACRAAGRRTPGWPARPPPAAPAAGRRAAA